MRWGKKNVENFTIEEAGRKRNGCEGRAEAKKSNGKAGKGRDGRKGQRRPKRAGKAEKARDGREGHRRAEKGVKREKGRKS